MLQVPYFLVLVTQVLIHSFFLFELSNLDKQLFFLQFDAAELFSQFCLVLAVNFKRAFELLQFFPLIFYHFFIVAFDLLSSQSQV